MRAVFAYMAVFFGLTEIFGLLLAAPINVVLRSIVRVAFRNPGVELATSDSCQALNGYVGFWVSSKLFVWLGLEVGPWLFTCVAIFAVSYWTSYRMRKIPMFIYILGAFICFEWPI